MRIRKRPGALFAADRAASSTSTSLIAINSGDGNGGEEFLLPLVAAVMNIQQAEDKEGGGDHGIHSHPVHNWRNALHLQRSGEGNSESQVLKDGVEGKKADWRWNGRIRNQWDNIRLFKKEKGTQGALLIKEDTSNNAEKDIIGDRGENGKLPKSGLLDMGNLRRQQKNLTVHGANGERSKDEIGYFKGWKDEETKTSKMLRPEIYIDQEDGRKVDEKAAMTSKRYNNNNNSEVEGSQCRRRNGRGWRCSQRTLVGYSLCEHHLGKGRLRSINSNNNSKSTGIVNNKAGVCKLKELRFIDASRSVKLQVNPDQQKPN